ncbi:MAG: VWA domain-containing protein [Thermoguttaceae bacterium]
MPSGHLGPETVSPDVSAQPQLPRWGRWRDVGLTVAALLIATVATLAAGQEPSKDPLEGLQPKSRKPEQPAYSVEPPPDGKARASLFGVSGEGYKFVYVFDRSGSMGGSGAASLRAVKAELRKSLESLEDTHQFQLIFYNDRPVVFNPTGVPGKLAFATERVKERALHFLDSIVAEGGTEHLAALKLAIRMRPDVIFFLTDGDEPKLSRHQLDEIRDRSDGITINTIEFGPGPEPEKPGFLVTLAEENSGHYVHVDTRTLRQKMPRQE